MPRIVGRDLSRRIGFISMDLFISMDWFISIDRPCATGLGRHAGGANTG
ncbi:hypothetical protein [Pseudoalteromonas sp. CO342X]|nr:hypothetical protein [Pseudoalteromonas sp. CO342X]